MSSLSFFTHPPPPATYTLSLHDALPICCSHDAGTIRAGLVGLFSCKGVEQTDQVTAMTTTESVYNRRWKEDRKSTRLNSSHVAISYAVFCLKKKKNTDNSACTSREAV